MSNKYEKLTGLLKELFQLDQPDLDFGLYRIMHAKSSEVTQFLETDLLSQINTAFIEYKSADKVVLDKELQDLISSVEDAGMDPNDSPRVQELKEKISTEGVDLDSLEGEVYDHLFSFFRRYYSEGDFLSKRVYKEGVYAIPYSGEEVKLHWANADQYYIKTSEYLRDYTFLLQPDDEDNPMRVHLRLADVQEGEHGNVKESDDSKRVFIFASGNSITEEDEELFINFEYRPATIMDWPESIRDDNKKPPQQKDLLGIAEEQIFSIDDEKIAPWLSELARPHIKSDGEVAEHSRLRAHINRYAARNTFDYFIHRDLGGFLRRELDFFIKNEVMHLDDIEQESVLRVEQYLSKIKVIRKIAGKVIDFLAQLEDFQKKLWLKKKFVTETSWCITIGTIPEDFYDEIVNNQSQINEWIDLYAIDEIEGDLQTVGFSDPLTTEFLNAYPTLVLDSRHFDQEFIEKLLDETDELDLKTDGMFINSDNFQALNIIQNKYKQEIDCIYIDPPYNAKSSEILYKNTFKDSSWISLMSNRLLLSKCLQHKKSVVVIAIDEVEQENLGLLLNSIYPEKSKTCITVIHNATGQQGNNFSATHEYAYFIYPKIGLSIGLMDRSENPDIRPLRNVSKGAHLRKDGANCFYPIFVNEGEIVGFGKVCEDNYHPKNINVIREDGIVEVYPIDNSGTERKWVFARQTVESILSELQAVKDKKTKTWDIVRTKTRFNFKTVWTDSKYSANSWGSRILNEIMGGSAFTFPKSIHTVIDCIDAALCNSKEGVVLDYFAGSGTTGHAVIRLNQRDGGQRKFILVEMGQYFDTVLLPRMKKVIFCPAWKDGKPDRFATTEEAEQSPRIMKVIRLESYEDTLNNLEIKRTDNQQSLLTSSETEGDEGFKEQYMLQYMLDVETKGSQSLLNISEFADPTSYTLKTKPYGSDEKEDVNVDLIETFNWLLGLTVSHISAPQIISAETERDAEKRLVLKGRLKESQDGVYWFRTVSGLNRDGLRVLVIWRKLTGDLEKDNLVLDEWFRKQGYSSKDSEFDLFYVNGDSNLENLRDADDMWKVRLTEEYFHRLMFADTDLE